MDRRLAALFLAVALLTTGCLAPGAGGPPADAPAEAAADPGESGPSATAQFDDADDPVVVSVEADREHALSVPTVDRATSYWERAEAAADRTYDVREDAQDPDVVVRVASEPVECGPGGEPTDYYCIHRPEGPDEPATAVISPGLTAEGNVVATAAALGLIAGDRAPLARLDLGEPGFTDPWPSADVVTVTVENEVDPTRDVEPLVREALGYWERHDDRLATYTTDWRVVDDPDAHVTVTVVPEIEDCGDHPDPESLIGCAPVRHSENLADGDEHVRVRGGYDDPTTLSILKHEFGHLYGLSHGDEPTDVMTDRITTSRR